MVRRKGELARTQKVNAFGGTGTINFEHMMELEKGEFYEKGRLFSILTIAPGDSLGYHVHTNEMECYYVLSGEGEYNDNNEEMVTIKEGDTTITLNGKGHGIANVSDKDLVFIGLVLFAE